MEIIKNNNLCIGCAACIDLCPTQCIRFELRSNNLTAVVDDSSCISCGLCSKVCQMNYPVSKKNHEICYAAWDTRERETSASGGIAASISKRFIEKEGVVFGSALQRNYVTHMLIDNVSEVDKLKGSKYVKSNLVGVYKQISNSIKQGKSVLFIGCPCQVAGVKNYCKVANLDLNKLFCIDLICHGTPNIEVLNGIIAKINGRLISFRDKNVYKLVFDKELSKNERILADSYILAFLNALTYNEACYNCQYAELGRIGDITIGDFWGIKNVSEEDKRQGVSIILVNTDKGDLLLNDSSLILIERSVNETLAENHQLITPATKHKYQHRFATEFPNTGVSILPKLLRKERVRKRISDFVYSNKITKTIYEFIKK